MPKICASSHRLSADTDCRERNESVGPKSWDEPAFYDSKGLSGRSLRANPSVLLHSYPIALLSVFRSSTDAWTEICNRILKKEIRISLQRLAARKETCKQTLILPFETVISHRLHVVHESRGSRMTQSRETGNKTVSFAPIQLQSRRKTNRRKRLILRKI